MVVLQVKELTIGEKVEIIQEEENNPAVMKWNFRLFCGASIVSIILH
jgi:hypothetical protein